jgi:hypothetical protein
MNQPIEKFCLCLRGKKGIFTKGKKYFVSLFYQLPDGDLMVQVQDDDKLTVQARATRFLLPDNL